MSGNVGSARQLDYTIHGDTVNTAARLEAMAKSTPRSLLMADSTYRGLTWTLLRGAGQPTHPSQEDAVRDPGRLAQPGSRAKGTR